MDWMACLTTMVPNDRYTPTAAGARFEWFKEDTRKYFPKDFLFDLAFAQSQLRIGHTAVISNFRAKRADYYAKPRAAASKPPVDGQK